MVVGHNPLSQGMTIYNGMSEYQFNFGVAHQVRKILIAQSIESQVFFRYSELPYRIGMEELANRAASYGATLGVELHCNALDGKREIMGSEVLVLVGANPETARLAIDFSLALQKRFGIESRHDNGLQEIPMTERGAHGMHAVREAGISPYMILEPAFCDVQHKDSEKIIEDPDSYACLLASTLAEYVKS